MSNVIFVTLWGPLGAEDMSLC